MTQPLLTIGIPTYNRESSVAMSIDSIVGRARLADPQDYEILVIDDDSTDRNWEIINELAARNPRIPFRLLRNKPKLAYDENVYRVYQEARGKFLWFISDRFLYNVDVPLVIDLIRRHEDLLTVTFSDLFRPVFPIPPEKVDDLGYVWDEATLAPLGGESLSVDGARYVLSTTRAIKESGALYSPTHSLFVATPDSIMKVNHSDEWMTTYRDFIGSYNQFVAGSLEPFRHDGSVAILQYPAYSRYSVRTNSGGNRHNWKAMFDFEPVFRRVFDFYPSMSERRRAGHRALLDFYLEHRAKEHMVIPVTRDDIEDFCRSTGYEPPAVFKMLVDVMELPLPRPMRDATYHLYRGAAKAKAAMGGVRLP